MSCGAAAGRRRWVVDVVGLGLVLALVAVGLVALRAYAGRDPARTPAPAATQVRPTAEAGPWPEAKRALDDHAAALVRGDEKGWLAAVDPLQPKLRAEYRRTFANLRQLGVTGFAYNVRFSPVPQPGRPELTTYPVVAFCFRRAVCPAFDLDRTAPSQPVSSFQQRVSMTRRDGRYVITAAAVLPGEPAVPPWLGELRFAQGKRVTVAAAPSQAKRLRAAVVAADKAAVAADRYAALVRNQREHYQVYLAGEAEWKTWFGGPTTAAVGYLAPAGIARTEVVLRTPEMSDGDYLLETVQHEFGHVVTLKGIELGWEAGQAHGWLIEGVAEYISFAPRPATANPSHPYVATAKKLPDTIAVPSLASSSAESVSRFYALGHHAVSCLVDRYGEPAFFGFFTKVLREGKGYDQASREAFGRPFPAVDRDCVATIRRLAR